MIVLIILVCVVGGGLAYLYSHKKQTQTEGRAFARQVVEHLALQHDVGFFAANLLKIADGGWIPLTFGGLVFVVMTTWHFGVAAIQRTLATMTESPARFLERLETRRIARVPGTAIFLTRITDAIAPLMTSNMHWR